MTTRALILVLACALALSADGPGPCDGPYIAGGNFTADLDGYQMSSESGDIWGTGDAWIFPLTFAPPDGRRVRVLELAGDLTARFTTRGAGPATARAGEYTGVLVAVQTLPESSGSVRGDWMADDTLVYRQGDVSAASGALRVPFRQDLRGVRNTLLEPDHRLYFKVAKYLDETRQTTHFEVTFNVIYQFEPESGCE